MKRPVQFYKMASDSVWILALGPTQLAVGVVEGEAIFSLTRVRKIPNGYSSQETAFVKLYLNGVTNVRRT